ncbi:neural cell adhesion molecule 1-like isoform X2 [Mobula birostris]|uniref:neural cell adhesion molecule 1-like isoform X2 n=1 Tax=Mobula birostris TaxID=1983395 RepID=UPI003B283416
MQSGRERKNMFHQLTVCIILQCLVGCDTGSVKLTIIPPSGNVVLGESRTFICKVENGEADSILWLVSNEDEVEDEVEGTNHIQTEVSEYQSKLEIINADPEVNGKYWCVASLENGKEQRKSITISVIEDPKFENILPIQEFEEGSDAAVLCHVVGIPDPTVSWKYHQEIVQSGRYSILSNGTLVIKNIQASDAGSYQCIGSIKKRSVRKSLSITVKVKYIPTFEPSEPQVLYSWLGNPVNISCTVRAYPEPNITWSRKSLDLGDIGVISKTSTEIRSVLQVRVSSPEEFSVYQCTATNAQGSASHTVQLREGGFPGIPRDLSAEPRSTTVQVSFSPPGEDSGIPVLGYWLEWRQNSSWKWNRTRVNNEYYLVTGLQPYTPYQFRVSAINGKGDGNYSDIVSARTLSIRGEPDRPSVSTRRESTGNNIRIFFKDVENRGSPVLRHFIRYKEVEADEWHSVTVNNSRSDSYLLDNLNWGSVYELEIEAENSNGRSVTSYLNVSVPLRSPAAAVGRKPSVGTGGVVGIILVIFVALLVVVDVVCYRTRRCGILMCLSTSLRERSDVERKGLDHEVDELSDRTTSFTDRGPPLPTVSKHC